MANITEVGASKVDIDSYQCSIKKVTASTKWKAPDQEVDEEVTTTVYDNTSKEGKDIYIVTSPKGKKVTIKTEREDGKCTRLPHKEYKMSWDDYTKEEGGDDKKEGEKKEGEKKEDNAHTTFYLTRTETKFNAKGLALAAGKDALLSAPIAPFLLPYNLIKTPILIEKEIKNEDSFKIKCFEIGGAWEALKYWRLPVPLDKKYVTRFSHISCKEGIVHYQIISYPDICFKLELSMKTNENPNKPKWLCYPALKASTTYNGKESELEFKLDFEALDKGGKDKKEDEKDKKEDEKKDKTPELLHFKYKDHGTLFEFGTELLQQVPDVIKKTQGFANAIHKICSLEILKDFPVLETADSEKPKILLPNISLSFEGRYHTSKDLTQIGKYYKINASLDPLIGVSYTIDILYLILNYFTGGAATGVYLLAKNLGPILTNLLGEKNVKKNEDGDETRIVSVSGDVYINLTITAQINTSFQYIIDTIKEDDNEEGKDKKKKRNYSITPVEGVVNLDLEAGVKASLKFFYIFSADGELSGSASSGITITIGFENRVKEGFGLIVPFEVLFHGLKIKYCAKATVGLKKVFSWGKGKESEKMLLNKKEIFTHDFVFCNDKSGSSEKKHGGGGGGGR